mgnify:CR=1 FL=1
MILENLLSISSRNVFRHTIYIGDDNELNDEKINKISQWIMSKYIHKSIQ